MTVREVNGDITTAPEQYLIHQTNCNKDARLASEAQIDPNHKSRFKTVASAIWTAFPFALVCRGSLDPDERVGTAEINGGDAGCRLVVNLFAQKYMGKGGEEDDAAARLGYFRRSIADFERQAAERGPIESVAMPLKIGCGKGGGDRAAYRAEIDAFAARHPRATVVLYDYDPPKEPRVPSVEVDPSGRAACPGCDSMIDKGALRVSVPRQVRGRETSPSNVKPACFAAGARVERAPNGRAKCQATHETIAKGDLRFACNALKKGDKDLFYRPAALAAFFKKLPVAPGAVPGFAALSADDQATFAALFENDDDGPAAKRAKT